MTTVTAPSMSATSTSSANRNPIWRTVRLHAVNPSVFFGIPWLIVGAAWALSMVIGIILHGSGVVPAGDIPGMRYSWAVLSPQWYLIVVGVQAIGLTFPFALGFGSTRRDFWLGTSTMFVLVSTEMAVAIATLVQIEKATNGWGFGVHVFDALWYGQAGWMQDFYTTFVLQLFVLFVGATATTIYMRWRIPGMLVFAASAIVLVVALIALLTFTGSWAPVSAWFMSIGIAGAFTVLLGLTVVWAIVGYLVIRRATTR
ncbi:hypothetical protein [Microbacterium candidum]|uniref:ABC transporter permease n=1 Tax=Microbacterium candidum TaxID=3041922 RepID=A0ABT7MVF9_9MICO|nr:hypothetical protein [Microbacterium sp. ASV49]MDL9978439.1 hypothetical protein [Microbacterium sp. ASV49]